jgi:hypothetical protein
VIMETLYPGFNDRTSVAVATREAHLSGRPYTLYNAQRFSLPSF